MPYQHRLVEKEGYLLVTGTEPCDLESTLEFMRRAKVELRAAPQPAVVVDIRRASYFPTQDEAKELAALLSDKELAGGRRVAFVVQPGVQYGLARMVSMFSGTEGICAHVFLEYEAAVAWAVKPVLLALSGGGYRAMLFHVGALWKLNEIGELGRLTHVSSVSGGSIAAGVLGMNWPRLKFAGGVAANFRDQVADPLMRLAKCTLDIYAGICGLIPFCSAATTMEYLYKALLFGKTTLGDLPESPWFTFNATNLQTGALWTFERDRMGDETLGELPATCVPLARAVAASSAFPPFLAPLVLRPRTVTWRPYPRPFSNLRSYDDLAIRVAELSQDQLKSFRKRVVLGDGGVVDNLGVLRIWGGKGDLFVSDGGGGAKPRRRPAHNWLSQLIRIVTLIHEQPSQLRVNRSKAEMADRDQRSRKSRSPNEGDGALWGMHWPAEDHNHDPPLPSLQKADWAHLADTPTRLWAIRPRLQMQLVNWGYIACNRSLPYVDRLFDVGPYASAFKESLPFPKARIR